MRKIILFNMKTLDGFFEGIDHIIDWHHVDAESNAFTNEQINVEATANITRLLSYSELKILNG